jgi:16S rRNA (uracil1498-N3)-methyltransferase
MKLHRFIRDFDFRNKILKISDKEIFNQVKNVLRLKVGDQIILADGKLNEALACIEKFEKDFFEVKILEISKNENEPKICAILYCSILKRENFEWVVQKATEVGVAEIVPLVTKRTVKLSFKKERLEKIIREAAEQSGRGIVPLLHPPQKFIEAIKKAESNDINLFFDISGQQLDKSGFNQKKRVGIFIGPEGGWDDEEIKIARQANFLIVSLGKLTLRAETAAIVASYFVSHIFGGICKF